MSSIFIPPPAKVLVTGANGFISVWICRQLLEAGYAVRGAVRDPSKGDYMATLFKSFGIWEKFEYMIVKDVASPTAYDAAVQGVDAVIHTASPVGAGGKPEDTINPAVQGTVSILSSSLRFGPTVKRIVVTSSAVSVLEPHDEPYLYTEEDWSESALRTYEEHGDETDGVTVYRVSKVMAERKAWVFMDEHKEAGFDLVTILPTYVWGPLLQDTSRMKAPNASMQVLTSCLVEEKTAEECGPYYSDWVDVRDTALAHVRAVQVPAAGGERFLVSGGPFAWQDIYDALATAEPPIPGIPRGSPGAKRTYGTPCSNEKSQQILGMTYKPLSETAIDAIRSLDEKVPTWRESKERSV
ncbi:NAD(P)-binding protein [Calocera viscosa TUFC12733]|uniref:NAD(P)-binding protein n=1 Tax=Calocera viscosa (strain TUFC12733) TaxID=1330018 RepID=A0A167FPX4_CALVF|nr:NAD(P)-binding protein [Calocera viscosa TUFC12733]